MPTNPKRNKKLRPLRAPPPPPLITRPTQTQMMYQAQIVISVNPNGDIRILKHREHPTRKKLSVNQTVEIMADMLCRRKYNGSMKIFQEVKKKQLIKGIKKLLREE